MEGTTPALTGSNLFKRKNRRRIILNNDKNKNKKDNDNKQQKILYYCLKPSSSETSILVNKPVIFFGYNDLKSYLTYISLKQKSRQRRRRHRHGKSSQKNKNDDDSDAAYSYSSEGSNSDDYDNTDDSDEGEDDKDAFLEYAIVDNLRDAYNYLILGFLNNKNINNNNATTSIPKIVYLSDLQIEDENEEEEEMDEVEDEEKEEEEEEEEEDAEETRHNRTKRQKLSTPTMGTTEPSSSSFLGHDSNPLFTTPTTTTTAKNNNIPNETTPKQPLLPESYLNEQRRERSKKTTTTTNSASPTTPATTTASKINAGAGSSNIGGAGSAGRGGTSSNKFLFLKKTKKPRRPPKPFKLYPTPPPTPPPADMNNNDDTNNTNVVKFQKTIAKVLKEKSTSAPTETKTVEVKIPEGKKRKGKGQQQQQQQQQQKEQQQQQQQQQQNEVVCSEEEKEWELNYTLVLEHKKAFGDCTLSKGGPQLIPVKQWLTKQKQYLKLLDKKEKQKCQDNNNNNNEKDNHNDNNSSTVQNRFTTEESLLNEERRQRLLDLIGVSDVKDIDAKEWDEMYALLEKYKQEHGYLPTIGDQYHKEMYPILFEWIELQRNYLKTYDCNNNNHQETTEENSISSEQRQRLLDIGVSVKSPGWNEMIELMKECNSALGEIPRSIKFKDEVPGKYRAWQTWVDDVREAVRQYYSDLEEDLSEYSLQESDDDESPTSSSPKRKKAKAKTSTNVATTAPSNNNNDDKDDALMITEERLHQLYELKCIQKPYKGWNVMFQLFHEYNNEFGTFHVPDAKELPEKYIDGFKRWVALQHTLVKAYDTQDEKTLSRRYPSNWKMTPNRRKRLADTGAFPILPFQSEWENMFHLFKEYKKESGYLCVTAHKSVPDKYRPLSLWIRAQQKTFKEYDEYKQQQQESMPGSKSSVKFQPSNSQGFETAEQRQRLLDFGFIADLEEYSKEIKRMRYDKLFERRMESLKAFKAKHGHLNVTKNSLRHWIFQMRRDYKDRVDGKENFLTLEHVSALTALGVEVVTTKVIKTRKTQKERIEEYIAFVKEHGREPNVRSTDYDERSIYKHGILFRKRRELSEQGITFTKNTGKCEISQEEIDLLDSVGFKWAKKPFVRKKKFANPVPFETHLERLKAYKAKHGHCEPPKRHPVLGNFVHFMRREYKHMVQGVRSTMTIEKFRQLSEIGFRFQVTETGRRRMRYLDNGSSGYDTSDGDNGENDKDNDDDNDDDNDNKDDTESDDDDDDDDDDNNSSNNHDNNNNERDISEARNNHNNETSNFGNDIRNSQSPMAFQGGGLSWLGF